MINTLKIGDHVAYSNRFLRSTGLYTGEIPFARGRVIATDSFPGGGQLVTVDWGNPDIPQKILAANLVLVNRIHLEPA